MIRWLLCFFGLHVWKDGVYTGFHARVIKRKICIHCDLVK